MPSSEREPRQLRRSARISTLSDKPSGVDLPKTKKKITKSKKEAIEKRSNKICDEEKKVTKKRKPSKKDETDEKPMTHLPRTIETSLISSRDKTSPPLIVVGIDEAGRGPLAGPVVAAAIVLPTNIPGITDSKKITSEAERERLYHCIINTKGVRWAATIIDSQRIDEINILQATMEAMKKSCEAIIVPPTGDDIISSASADRKGCYTVTGSNHAEEDTSVEYHALVDGNRVPKEMICDASPIIKGDSKEYSIGAASIIAKVTRDLLMREYDKMYPEFNLKKHKGYPTAAHMALVREHGASPIHRRTFAPLKHMEFDDDGKVVVGRTKSK